MDIQGVGSTGRSACSCLPLKHHAGLGVALEGLTALLLQGMHGDTELRNDMKPS